MLNKQCIDQYGSNPSEDCVIVTTLAPCTNANSSCRLGDSCRNLIEKHGIKRVHAGLEVDGSIGRLVTNYKAKAIYERVYGS